MSEEPVQRERRCEYHPDRVAAYLNVPYRPEDGGGSGDLCDECEEACE